MQNSLRSKTFNREFITNMEEMESRATDRSNKGNTHMEKNIKNIAGIFKDDLSSIKSEIDSNRMKIESEAKIQVERYVNLINLIQSNNTINPPILSEITV